MSERLKIKFQVARKSKDPKNYSDIPKFFFEDIYLQLHTHDYTNTHNSIKN